MQASLFPAFTREWLDWIVLDSTFAVIRNPADLMSAGRRPASIHLAGYRAILHGQRAIWRTFAIQ